MIDINALRVEPEKFKKATANKNKDPNLIDQVLEADKLWREILKQVEDLRSERNIAAKAKDIEKGKEIKNKLKEIEPKLKEAEVAFDRVISHIPNLASEDTPVGKDESENVVVRKWGEPRKFDFTPKDHVDLGRELDIIDIETAAEVTGARFAYLKGDAVLLQFALIQYAFETLTNVEKVNEIAKTVGAKEGKAFTPVVPPVMIKTEVMAKMDRLEPQDDRFILEKDDLALVGSAEHTLGPLYMNKTFNEKDLPIRLVGYSTAFRREAGSYGRDTRGILRVHQFDKLEMESFSAPQDGMTEHYLMTAIQEHFMLELGLPHEVMAVCTGDMGKPDFKQTDVNTWIPTQEKYRETHTADYMTDYQSRRLNTKVNIGGKTEYAHMNDATAIAIGRTLIAILENYQEKDGSVTVPEVLRKWMGKDKITK